MVGLRCPWKGFFGGGICLASWLVVACLGLWEVIVPFVDDENFGGIVIECGGNKIRKAKLERWRIRGCYI